MAQCTFRAGVQNNDAKQREKNRKFCHLILGQPSQSLLSTINSPSRLICHFLVTVAFYIWWILTGERYGPRSRGGRRMSASKLSTYRVSYELVGRRSNKRVYKSVRSLYIGRVFGGSFRIATFLTEYRGVHSDFHDIFACFGYVMVTITPPAVSPLRPSRLAAAHCFINYSTITLFLVLSQFCFIKRGLVQ